MLLLAGTAWIFLSHGSGVHRQDGYLVCRRAFPKTFIFVGVLLTYLLWGAMVKTSGKQNPGWCSLFWQWGVYFSAFAGRYALGKHVPKSRVVAISLCR